MLSHDCQYRVIYGDTDKMGVVYYANYFRIFEYARASFCRHKRLDYNLMEERGYALPVVSASCDYSSPATYGDLLDISLKLDLKDSYRACFFYTVKIKGQLIASGATSHVLTYKSKIKKSKKLLDLIGVQNEL